MTDVAQIVAGLTKASKRALMKIGTEWTTEGHPGPARADVYSLWWGRDGHHKLVDNKVVAVSSAGVATWAWKLSRLGLAVRTALLSKDGDSADA